MGYTNLKEATVGEIVQLTKRSLWRYFGAMFMEKKDGVQAVSLTRILALVCFGYLSHLWLAGTPIPDTLLYTFWGLLGGKTAESVFSIWKGKKGA